MLSFLRLLQLSSANLPVGGFTYSQGLEWAVEAQWVTNYEQTYTWFATQMDTSLVFCDLPLLSRLYSSCASCNIAQFRQWTRKLLRLRETHELRLEETQRGLAFYRFLQGLECFSSNDSSDWQDILQQSQLSGLAWYAVQNAIPLKELQYGWSYSWLESNTMAAIKLVPLGQQAGQKLLYQLSASIPNIIEKAHSLVDEALGASSPLVAIASSCHETQYTRLFRS